MKKKQGFLLMLFVFLSMIIHHLDLSYSKEFANSLIIVPGPNTECYNASYYFLALNISKDYDLPLIIFNCTNLSTLDPVKFFEKNTSVIYAFVAPSHLTPDLMFDTENYLRFGGNTDNFAIFWISSYNADDAKRLFLRNKSNWVKNYWMGNFSYLYGETTKNYASKFTQYEGEALNYTNVIKAFSDKNTGLVYAHLNEKTSNEFLVYNNVICPYGDENVGIASNEGDIFLQNLVLFLDNSYAGRVYGALTNTEYTSFDFVNPNIIKWNSTIPIAFSHIYNTTGPYDAGKIEISPVAYRFAGTDDFGKLFIYSLKKSNDVAFALKFAKNYYLIMGSKALNKTVRYFDDFIAFEYQAFGSDSRSNFDGKSLMKYIIHRKNLPILINLSASHSSRPVTWIADVYAETPYPVNAIYNKSKILPSVANLWYFDGGKINTNNKEINLSAVEALYDYWIPDENEIKILNINYTSNPRYLYYANVSLMNNNISAYSIGRIYLNTSIVSNDSRFIYLVSLFSINKTLDYPYYINFNVSYQTGSIRIYPLENDSRGDNIFELSYMICNPSSYPVSNLTILIPLPNDTVSCSATYSNSTVNCTLLKNNSSNIVYGEINMNDVYLMPSCEGLSVEYKTDANGNVTTNHIEYNRGEIVTTFFNLSSTTPVSSNISVMLLNIENDKIVWENNSLNNISLSNKNSVYEMNYTIPLNETPGEYYVIVMAIDTLTKKPVFKKETKIIISDELKLKINLTDLINNLYNYKIDWNYFNQTDSLKLTGVVENIRGESISGANVTAIVLNKTQIGSGSALSTKYGVFSLTLSWINAEQREYSLILKATYENNTGNANEPIYITSIPKYVFISINATPSATGKYLFSIDQEIVIKVHVLNTLNKSAAFIPINISSVPSPTATSNSVLKVKTNEYGDAYLYIKPPLQVSQYKIYVTATDPLNKSITLNNQTANVYVLTLKVFKYDGKMSFIWKQTPDPAIKDEDVYFKGNLSLEAPFPINKSKIVGRSITYKLIASGSDVTSYSSCSLNIGPSATSPEFEIVCKPHSAVTHCLYMDGYINYAGITIHRKNVAYCFEVKENETSSSTTTSKTTTTKTSKSLSKAYVKHCYTNTDCLTTEYCDKNNYVCKPLSCSNGYVAFNHTCITPNAIYNLEIKLPDEIKVMRGKKATYTMEIKNIGHAKITHLSVSCESKYINWKNWCSITGSLDNNLMVGKSIKLNITFFAPSSVKPDIYPFSLKISADHLSTEKSAALVIYPNKKDVAVLNTKLDQMNKEIKNLIEELTTLSKKWNTTGVNIGISKLTQALTLIEDAKSNMASGNYLQAQKEINQAQKLMNVVSQIYDLESKNYHKHKRKILEISIGLIVLLSGIGIFYYLWSLPSASPYSKNLFSKDIFGRSKASSIFEVRSKRTYIYGYSSFSKMNNIKKKLKDVFKKLILKFRKNKTSYSYGSKGRWFRI